MKQTKQTLHPRLSIVHTLKCVLPGNERKKHKKSNNSARRFWLSTPFRTHPFGLCTWVPFLWGFFVFFLVTCASSYCEQGHTRQKSSGHAFLIKIKWARRRMANIFKILRTWPRERGKDPTGSSRNTIGSWSATRETSEPWSLEKLSPTDGGELWHQHKQLSHRRELSSHCQSLI